MKDEDIERMKAALNEYHKWPSLYMFKFIVPADNEKLAQVQSLFNSKTAEVISRPSKKGNFYSITAKEVMMSAQKVIEKYEKAAKIEGLISL